MVSPVAPGPSISSHYLPFVADKGLEMKNQGDANCQDDSCCHVIPGLELSEKGLKLDLKVRQSGGRTLLCIHFQGHSHCRATIKVDTATLLGVLSKHSVSIDEV